MSAEIYTLGPVSFNYAQNDFNNPQSTNVYPLIFQLVIENWLKLIDAKGLTAYP